MGSGATRPFVWTLVLKTSTRLVVQASLTALLTSPLALQTAQATPDCVRSFSNLIQRVREKIFVPQPRVQVCSYEWTFCFENVLPILRSLKSTGQPSGEDLEGARVLYVSRLKAWNVHVVVEHRGRIYDADLGKSENGRFSIPGIPVETYFANNRTLEESRVLEIPGERYLREYDHVTWPNYQRQLFEEIPRAPGVHRWTVNGFLRRLRNQGANSLDSRPSE